MPDENEQTNIKEWALAYVKAGWHVVPLATPQGSGCSCGKSDCSKIGKHPRIADWQNVTTDVETVAAWWDKWPDANIGLRLDGLVVLDVVVVGPFVRRDETRGPARLVRRGAPGRC